MLSLLDYTDVFYRQRWMSGGSCTASTEERREWSVEWSGVGRKTRILMPWRNALTLNLKTCAQPTDSAKPTFFEFSSVSAGFF